MDLWMSSLIAWSCCSTLFGVALLLLLWLLTRSQHRAMTEVMTQQLRSNDSLARLLASRDPLTYQMLQAQSPLSVYDSSSPDSPESDEVAEDDYGDSEFDDPSFADIHPEFLVDDAAYRVGRREQGV